MSQCMDAISRAAFLRRFSSLRKIVGHVTVRASPAASLGVPAVLISSNCSAGTSLNQASLMLVKPPRGLALPARNPGREMPAKLSLTS